MQENILTEDSTPLMKLCENWPPLTRKLCHRRDAIHRIFKTFQCKRVQPSDDDLDVVPSVSSGVLLDPLVDPSSGLHKMSRANLCVLPRFGKGNHPNHQHKSTKTPEK